MDYVMITELLVEPEFESLVRKVSDEDFQDLCDSIRMYGIRTPIIVWRNEVDDLVVVDGHHRYRAAQAVGLSEVPIDYLSVKDDQELYSMVIELNLRRRHMSPGERAEYAVKLDEFKDLSTREVASIIGVSKNTVHRARSSVSNGTPVSNATVIKDVEGNIRKYLLKALNDGVSKDTLLKIVESL